jgi:hypothetical protein
MTIVRFDEAPLFEPSGVRIGGFASPVRGATETMTYRVELAGGQRVPRPHARPRGGLPARLGPLDRDDRRRGLGARARRYGDDAGRVIHGSFTLEGDEAVILTSMPVGTLLIRTEGERVAPPWSE